jgi:hypothetical protein
MKLYLAAMKRDEYWNGTVYVLTLSDDYIPLWKRAGIYDLLYEKEGITGEQISPILVWALTEMCIQYTDYRSIVKIPLTDDEPYNSMDELLREQAFRTAVAILSMLLQAVITYPQATLCREKEGGPN